MVPSHSESFGLVAVEAQACGTPVLAARATALPETGGDAAVYVDDPHDAENWCRALRRLTGDPAARAVMAAAGPPRAARFDWETCAQRTLEVLRRTAARP